MKIWMSWMAHVWYYIYIYISALVTIDETIDFPGHSRICDSSKHWLSPCLLQLVPDASADYFLMEEKMPLSKEKCDAKKVPQQRPLVSDERVLRVLHGWQPEEGYVGRICLKAKEEVNGGLIQRSTKYVYNPQSQNLFLVYRKRWKVGYWRAAHDHRLWTSFCLRRTI